MKSQKLQSSAQKTSPLSQKTGASKLTPQQKRQKKIEVKTEDEEIDHHEIQELQEYFQEQESQTITDKEFYKAMQKLKERGNNAVPPKKSASAYIIFGKEKRAEILKRNPTAKVTEVVKEIAQSWGKLGKEEKQKYKEAAKKDKERYEKELRSLESFSEKLKKPKKCLSAYMIFVKETRPLIVEEHQEMGALQVMQEVGKQWQALTEEQKSYFKEKADKDKMRYLNEQRAFYDEVEKIGQKHGTVTTKDGQIAVAAQQTPNDQFNKQKPRLNNKGNENSSSQQSQLQKRKLIVKLSNINQGESPQKRIKNEEFKVGNNNGMIDQQNSNKNMIPIGQQNTENKPKKPLSAYIYFSQEFREIIRQKFPTMTVAQVMKAVSHRWSKLTKEQKQPFEQIANEDKLRYDREIYDCRKGLFQGRSLTPSIRIQSNNDAVSSALEISEDLYEFLQVAPKQENDENGDDQFENYDENLEDQEYEDQVNNNMENIEEQNNLQSNNLKVVIENFDEVQMRNRKDSLINPLLQGIKFESEDHVNDMQNNMQSMPGMNMSNNNDMNTIGSTVSFGQASMMQIPHNQHLQACLSPFGFNDGGQRNYMLQNELAKRESERKTSMNFNYGTGFFTQQSPAMNPIMTSSMFNMPFLGGLGGLQDEQNQLGYLMSSPFQLPPSNHQLQPSATFGRPSGQGNQLRIPGSSPQLGAMAPPNQMMMNPNSYLGSSNNEYASTLSPFLAPQPPQQFMMSNQQFQSQGMNGYGQGSANNSASTQGSMNQQINQQGLFR